MTKAIGIYHKLSIPNSIVGKELEYIVSHMRCARVLALMMEDLASCPERKDRKITADRIKLISDLRFELDIYGKYLAGRPATDACFKLGPRQKRHRRYGMKPLAIPSHSAPAPAYVVRLPVLGPRRSVRPGPCARGFLGRRGDVY